MKFSFQDKVVIVTGASSGIGLATARLLSRRGAKVVLAARSKDRLETYSKEMPRSVVCPTDVTEPGAAANLAKTAVEKFGRIDILVNNAGILLYKLMEDTPPEELRKVMEVNYFGAVAVANAVLPAMAAQKSGTIVNVSSVAGRVGFPNLGYYCASKFAFTGYSESLRQEAASKGVKVVLVSPGTIYTAMTQSIVDDALARGKRMIITPPEKVAEAILRGIEKGSREVFIPWQTSVLNHLHFHLPGFAEWLAGFFRASDKKSG